MLGKERRALKAGTQFIALTLIGVVAQAFVMNACQRSSSEAQGETRSLDERSKPPRVKGSASWSKWCAPLGLAEEVSVKGGEHKGSPLPCPAALRKEALKALYPKDMWPVLSAPGESVEIFYEQALSIEASTSLDTQCCYSVKHALAPPKRAR